MEEKWLDIAGFEGYYQVSNTGRIKSFRKGKRYGKPEEFILKSSIANTGYCQVTLYKPGTKKKFLVHRLVAEAFLDNPNNYQYINHKDETRTNNNVENLEWCTARYNNMYGTARLRSILTEGKPVSQCLPSGQHIATYTCVSVAAKINRVDRATIICCCNGRCSTAGGYVWKYEPNWEK